MDYRDSPVVVDIGGEQASSNKAPPRPKFLIAALLVVALAVTAAVIATRTGRSLGTSEDALNTAMAEFEATYNNGDVAGFLDLFNESSVVGGELLKLANDPAADLAWEFEWNPRIELSLCRVTRPRQSSCRFVRTTDFYTPLGLTERGVLEFALDPDDGKLARVDLRVDPQLVEAVESFNDEFYAWVEAHYPEVSLTGQQASRDRPTWVAMRDGYLSDVSN